jgi:hypothetical protein
MQALIFTGIQTSGKTTFYRERFFETHIRISLDMLRTRNREQILLQACLEARQPFVKDNTKELISTQLAVASDATKMVFTNDRRLTTARCPGGFMEKAQMPITCPICGRKNNFRVEELAEGATLVCPLCKLKLTLCGHMWEDIQRELQKTKADR